MGQQGHGGHGKLGAVFGSHPWQPRRKGLPLGFVTPGNGGKALGQRRRGNTGRRFRAVGKGQRQSRPGRGQLSNLHDVAIHSALFTSVQPSVGSQIGPAVADPGKATRHHLKGRLCGERHGNGLVGCGIAVGSDERPAAVFARISQATVGHGRVKQGKDLVVAAVQRRDFDFDEQRIAVGVTGITLCDAPPLAVAHGLGKGQGIVAGPARLPLQGIAGRTPNVPVADDDKIQRPQVGHIHRRVIDLRQARCAQGEPHP